MKQAEIDAIKTRHQILESVLTEALQAVTVLAVAPVSGFPPTWQPGAQRYLDLHERIRDLLESEDEDEGVRFDISQLLKEVKYLRVLLERTASEAAEHDFDECGPNVRKLFAEIREALGGEDG